MKYCSTLYKQTRIVRSIPRVSTVFGRGTVETVKMNDERPTQKRIVVVVVVFVLFVVLSGIYTLALTQTKGRKEGAKLYNPRESRALTFPTSSSL